MELLHTSPYKVAYSQGASKELNNLPPLVKVVRILKKRAREMSCSGKVSRTFEFLRVFGAAEKSLRAAEESKEKVESNYTGFSLEFFGSQPVEMFCFARKTKIQKLTRIQ